MKNLLRFLLFTCFVHGIANGEEVVSRQQSFSANLVCPESISVDQKIADSPMNWEATNLDSDKYYPLISASLFSGHPSLMVKLRESDEHSDLEKGSRLLKYSSLSVHKNDINLVCNYEATSVVVFKKISPQPSDCSIIVKRSQNGLESIRADCQ